MITQMLTQGKNEIRIETAESMEDAKKNGFGEGEMSRYFVNGKKTDNYMGMIQFLVKSTLENRERFDIPVDHVLSARKTILQRHHREMKDQVEKIRREYGVTIPNSVAKELEDIIDKLNAEGMRVAE